MTLWFLIAVMTCVAVFSVLLPLGRRNSDSNAGADTAVYADQLAELTRDHAAGTIAFAEAEAARVEISRRLLLASAAKADARTSSRTGWRRAIAVIALLLVPAVAVGTYAALGTPQLPDFPLVERLNAAPSPNGSVDRLVAQVESHLEKNPRDARGWTVIAPIFFKLGRFDDAVRAYRNSIAFGTETPAGRADLGEAITAAANGVVTQPARVEFLRAVELEPGEAKAQYFLGLSSEQDGKPDDAAAIWRQMLAQGPTDAPWRPMVQAALARVAGPAMPKLNDETIAAAKDMNADEQKAMIQGMVAGLAERLKVDGKDPQAWMRLVRAYLVLGEQDKAATSAADARKALADDADRLKSLNDGLKSIGFDG